MGKYNSFEDLLLIVKEAEKKTGNTFDTELISEAYSYARASHGEQLRASGEPYIVHPVSVACILVEIGMDTDSIIAALLHDVVEDTPVTAEEIEKKYGKSIAGLIDGVTKLDKVSYSTEEERQAENVRKMFIAMNKDIRVIIIKLADRLNNMRTLGALPELKRRKISLETMEIFAPIADRVGIRWVKEELEDIAMKYLDPYGYNEIKSELDNKNPHNLDIINRVIGEIKADMDEKGIAAEIYGRTKSIYGIYQKMFKLRCTIDEIYDVYAVRVIVENVDECFHVLGFISQKYRPIPGRFKNYIATPKPNGYQSLHTVVYSPADSIPFEVQIRTSDMHRHAEDGIAAHWKYKLGVSSASNNMDRMYVWIRSVLERQNDGEPIEILDLIKHDYHPETIFVLTPMGDIKQLPIGATIIDFAYSIHSNVGNKMIGAKVGSKMVPITSEAPNGDVVEIITTKDPHHGPSRDWLKVVKTSEARTKIRSWFKKERREENIAEGSAAIARELKQNSIPLNGELTSRVLLEIAGRFKFETIEDLYAAIGYGGVMLSRAVPKIIDEYHKQRLSLNAEEEPLLLMNNDSSYENKGDSDGIIIDGTDNLLTKYAKCCHPLPGDDIIGFITRGYGVSIHKRGCTNVPGNIAEAPEPERWVPAKWKSKSANREYNCTIEIQGYERQGLIADISVAMANMHLSTSTWNSHISGDVTNITITFKTNSTEHVNTVKNKLEKIKGIISVKRK
ncbi:MAG: bifunctional (p)ppGpp synthetase/guanosine-3',5'-bis(diphosphate) 3'-pyrophosphohydrolase [Oscillospiraceae bacterium]|nr:bifunctional (p)ppGpp synthetase/guanosine-3',5'-bis(diphosphate) 3'-pyrophosphohydrolase [Oscillospiraceae bacterium]